MEFKEILTCKMINTLERALPGIRDHIVHKELGTPMTNKHYLNATNGSVYGTEKSFGQIGPFAFRAKSEIENLYMCGASIQSHGVAGASYSGVQTAAVILNCKQHDLIKPDLLQNIRIFEAEDDSAYTPDIKQKINLRKARLITYEKKSIKIQ